MQAMCREIGERGRSLATQAAAPSFPPPAPAPAPDLEPSPATPAGQTFVAPAPVPQPASASTMLEMMRLMHAEAASSEARHNARLDSLRAEMASEMERRCEREAAAMAAATTSEQLAALEARLQALRVAELLTDGECIALEDVIGDYLTGGSHASGLFGAKVRALVSLSEGWPWTQRSGGRPSAGSSCNREIL